MSDDLDLMQLARGGELLATVDDVGYTAIHVVFAWAAGGVPTVYCPYAEWAASSAARLAAKDREIAELAALAESRAQQALDLAVRVAELERQLAAPQETPKQNQEKMFSAQALALDKNPGSCPDCGETGWKSARALQMHRQRAHQGMVAGKKGQPVQFVEELGWHCAAKGCAGAHARDMHDPAFCTLHAQRQFTNGVETAA